MKKLWLIFLLFPLSAGAQPVPSVEEQTDTITGAINRLGQTLAHQVILDSHEIATLNRQVDGLTRELKDRDDQIAKLSKPAPAAAAKSPAADQTKSKPKPPGKPPHA